MVDARVVQVKISHKNASILNESSKLETNDLKELISVLKAAQKVTNECLTRLTKDTQESGEKSAEEDDSEDDLSVENDPELSPKRAKLKN